MTIKRTSLPLLRRDRFFRGNFWLRNRGAVTHQARRRGFREAVEGAILRLCQREILLVLLTGLGIQHERDRPLFLSLLNCAPTGERNVAVNLHKARRV